MYKYRLGAGDGYLKAHALDISNLESIKKFANEFK